MVAQHRKNNTDRKRILWNVFYCCLSVQTGLLMYVIPSYIFNIYLYYLLRNLKWYLCIQLLIKLEMILMSTSFCSSTIVVY